MLNNNSGSLLDPGVLSRKDNAVALETITSNRRHGNINSRQCNISSDVIMLWVLWEKRHKASLGAGSGEWKEFRHGFLENLTSELSSMNKVSG